MRHPIRVLVLALAAVMVGSCNPTGGTEPTTGGGTGGPGAPVRMVIKGGNNQAAASGNTVAIAPSVLVLDADGLAVPSVLVAFAITAGGGSIPAGNVITDAAGVASVGSWRLGATLGTNTLTATSAGLTGSPITFNASATVGPASRLVIQTQPTAAVAGQILAPAYTIEVQDAQGNPVPGTGTSITASITVGTGASGATLSGTKVRSANASGTAIFDDLRIIRAGTDYTISVTASGLTGAVSNAFDVAPGAASRLVMTAFPSTTIAGNIISPSVVVAVQDNIGNTITTSSASIALAITAGTGTPGAALNGTVTRSAVAGVSTFPGLKINTPGTAYTITASTAGLTSVVSDAFDILAGAPSQLVLTGGPTSATAGQLLAPALNVAIQDALGNPVSVTGTNITVAITPGTGSVGAVLAGTKTRPTNGAGSATFNDLSIAKAGIGFTLTVTATGFPSLVTGTFDVAALAPSQVVFTTQPVSTIAGDAIAPSVVAAIQDNLGNTITSSSASISIAITAGTGTPGALLIGTVTRGAVGGVATFPGLKINTSGATYSFTATGAGLTSAVSNSFDISPAAPAQLVLSGGPVAGNAGQLLAPALTVGVQDAFGNTVVSAGIPVTVAITAGTGTTGATLGGTKTKLTTSLGTAVFNDLVIGKSGTAYSLTSSSAPLVPATSAAFDVAPAAAAALTITAQPTGGVAGSTLSPSVTVTILDASGNPATTATNSVTLAITGGTGTPGALLSGTVTRAAVAGVATFPGLSIDKSGAGYSFTATSGGLTGATSSAFDVSPGAPTQIIVTVQPSTVELGSVMAPSVKAEVRDALGNVATASTNPVSVAVTVGSGTVVGVNVGGTTTLTPVAGVVTFNNLTFDKDGTGFTLSLTAPGLTTGISNAFTVTNANFIYFSSNRTGSYEVWRMKADGTAQSQVTSRSMASDPTPAKNSANGRVAFSDGSPGIQALYTMNGDGTVQQLVQTHSDAGQASWSPDGTTLVSRVAAGSPSFGLFTIKADGSARTQITGGLDHGPSWSPTGTRVSFVRKSLTPGIAPDTMMIVPSTGGPADSLLVVLGVDSLVNTAWSPDGQRIVVVVVVGGDREIFVVSSLGGGAFTNLTSNPAVDDTPTWSPDGTKILFQSDRSGTMQIWSMNADGSNLAQLTNAGTSFSPSWWN